MKDFKKFIQLPFSTKMALVSFVIGTVLFASYFIFRNSEELIYIGLCSILLAIFCNGIMLFWLIHTFITEPEERKDAAIQILVLLANIPIAVLYAFVIINTTINNSPF
jgi:hypothetical protein